MVKYKVLELANKIGMTKMGSKSEILPEHPQYKILAPVVTDAMATTGLYLEIRQKMTAQEVADLSNQPLELVTDHLLALADAGVCFVNNVDGVDVFWLEVYVPGVMEMMVNHKENVKNHPEIAEAFEEYGRYRGPQIAGNIPVGVGVMRVIPIEEAIMGDTRKASYEEVSHHINTARILSVSDCACRTSREVMGEGCGHLKEDMCIQLNHAAEYYIRTGRGREVSKEEAMAIIKKAEENGLMHQIPNTEGPGTTHAICNCCGCSCFSLRFSNMFNDSDMMRSNYQSEVTTENCVGCGECVETCPVGALQLGQQLCNETPLQVKPKKTIRDYDLKSLGINEDYRTNMQVNLASGTSPCKSECPAHIGIQGYIKLASQGRYEDALALIKKENPFPAVCGRICPRNCESACTRGDLDEAIAIDDIKKFIAEKDLHEETRYIPKKQNNYGNKIAIIGGGPSGLSCAFYLAIDGYDVTVFEKSPVLGGMLTLGIPAFRLSKSVIHSEIEVLKSLGVNFKMGIEVGKDVTLENLRKQGYEAFYMAIGAQGGRALNVQGEDAIGVQTGIDFLRKVNLDIQEDLKGPTLVIGGGNVAIDVARTARRLSKSSVSLISLESLSQMPALDEEIHEAKEEAIEMHHQWGVKEILQSKGKVVGVRLMKCLSIFDEKNKFNPVYDIKNTMDLPCENVLVSVGQTMDWGHLIQKDAIELWPNQTIKVDPITLQSSVKDIFSGGDVATGPKFAIDAIAQGKEAAISIHRYVHPGQSLTLGRINRNYFSFDKSGLALDGYDTAARQKPYTAPIQPENLYHNFKDPRGVLAVDQIKKETERCLGCGVTVVNPFLCVGCGSCTTKCKFDAIHLVKKYDAPGVQFEEIRPSIMKHAVKRKIKITAKSPGRFVMSKFRS